LSRRGAWIIREYLPTPALSGQDISNLVAIFNVFTTNPLYHMHERPQRSRKENPIEELAGISIGGKTG
jgi:hypothetical protein